MNSVQSTPPLRKTDLPGVPGTTNAPGYGETRAAVPVVQASNADQGQQPETYQADRAFNALLARLTGGISTVDAPNDYVRQ